MDSWLTVTQAARFIRLSERLVWQLLAYAGGDSLARLLHGNREPESVK